MEVRKIFEMKKILDILMVVIWCCIGYWDDVIVFCLMIICCFGKEVFWLVF